MKWAGDTFSAIISNWERNRKTYVLGHRKRSPKWWIVGVFAIAVLWLVLINRLDVAVWWYDAVGNVIRKVK